MEQLISGTVISVATPQGLPGARVEAWDAAGEMQKPLAIGSVRSGGGFTLILGDAVARLVTDRQLTLDLRLVYQGALLRLEPPVTWTPGEPAALLRLAPRLGADGSDPDGARTVFGSVTGPGGRPAVDVVVRAHDRDLRAEELLGETRTGTDGRYSIGYTAQSFARAEKAAADLVVRVFDANGEMLHEPAAEDVIFNAAADLRHDIRLGEPVPAAQSEYEALESALEGLLGAVAPADISEHDTNRDVTFLSLETGTEARRVEHFAVAHRLAALIDADPVVFYALLRMDTLLDPTPVPFQPVRVAIGVSDDANAVLKVAAGTDPKRITADVRTAIERAIVPAAARRSLPKVLEALKGVEPEPDGGLGPGPDALLDVAGRLMEPERLQRFQELLAKGQTDLPGLLEELVTGSLLDLADDAAPAAGNGVSATLRPKGLGLKAVAEAAGLRGKVPEAELATLPPDALTEALRKAAPDLSQKARKVQQRRIERKLSAAWPAEVFRARVAEGRAPVSEPARAKRLFKNHRDLDLTRSNLDRVFAQDKLEKPADRLLLRELKTVQRILKVAPDLDRAEGLIAARMQSAADIVGTGRTRFLNEVAPDAGLSPTEAQSVYGRAESAHAAAMLIAGEARDLTAIAPAAAPSTSVSALLAASPEFPNLASLFGGTDTCECGHCRSVYSPAAYLVELIEFLGKRSMVDLTQSPPAHVNLAQEQLFARRPEIADLDLDCANAETPLPYIDLACEILEGEIAPDPGVVHNGAVTAPAAAPAALLATLRAAGWRITDGAIVQEADINGDLILRDPLVTAKLVNQGGNAWRVFRLRNTRSTAAELAAAPEYVNLAAYAALKAARYAFTLPFDLDHTEATAYFDRFGLKRADLMEHFRTGAGPALAAIAGETLGMTEAHRTLVVTPAATNAGQSAVWAIPSGQVVARMTVVATFLEKTGLDYDGLDRLLQLGFIDPAGVHFIRHLDLSCDLTQKEVEGLDAALLDRVHRFLRLKRATGWEDTVLDAALTDPALGGGTLNDAALIRIGLLARIGDRTGLTAEELAACFGRFAHAEMTGPGATPSFYHRVFLDKSALGYVEEGLRPETVAAGGGTLSALAGSLSALLRLTAEDFEQLRAALTDDALSFANLSRLFGAARLAARLKLTPADLLTLIARTALDPFGDPAAMVEFVRQAERMRTSAVKVADMDYVLEHDGPDVAVKGITDDRVAELLLQLQAAYQTAYAGTKSAFDAALTAEELRTPIKEALLRLPDVGEDGANTILRMYDADWASPPDAPAGPTLAELLGGFFDTTALAADQAAVAAAAPAALEAARITMAGTLLTAVSDHLLELAKREALTETVAAFFSADADLTETILNRASLRQPGPQIPLLGDALTSDALIDTAGDPAVPPAISEAAFPTEYRAVRLLHKLLPVAAAMALDRDDLDWVLANGGDLGWQRLDALPYEAGQGPVPQAGWDRLMRARALFAAYPPAADPADPAGAITFRGTLELLRPGAGTARAAWLDALALLTAEDRATLDAVDAHFGWSTPNLNAWRLPETWESLALVLADLRTLSVSTADAVALVQPVLTPAQSALLRTALKARYDEAIWLTTLGEITNAIRGPKRDALVAFLLAERAEFATATDLYDHFLIDVEMEAKMPSSRIVQAHGTIQTFVERSRMGLEPAAAADSADSGWEQWTWMKNYRVWEANRKVFVYPENWIEPELLDDKSPLFEAFEDELLQNEVNDDTTERAFIRYLETLDDIAFLEVVACYYETAAGTMHVVARTKGGDPAQYYHRTIEKERYWSPWRAVDLDITSDSLLAFVRNDRLHLAWPVISEETDPDAEVTTPGVSESPSTGPMQRPSARLRIQLALSDYAGGLWKPKKISEDAIITPTDYSSDSADLERTRFNLMYHEFTDQIWLFRTFQDGDQENHERNGMFDIAGCKGYPEVVDVPTVWLPDFYPDYTDTALRKQRYIERGLDRADTLAIRTVLSPAAFVVRLNTTPGTFRITHPHQFTALDFIYTLLEILFLHTTGMSGDVYQRLIKIPYGTWLPYFFEDSSRAYVVVPGLYSDEPDDPTRRTASDFFQLLRDMLALAQKYTAILTADPAPSPADVLEDLAVDPDFLHIQDEIELYFRLRAGEQFRNLYHPLICALRRTLYADGVGAMMERDQQLQQTNVSFDTTFNPTAIVVQPHPIEDVDFTSDGAYSPYNWESFFHAPLTIAKRLASEQRFEEAMEWYHRIFDPTGTLEGTAPQKYWVTKPFYLTSAADYLAQRIDTILTELADPTSAVRHELELAVGEWRDKPFRPHVVARFRTVAYQRTVVMNYIGTLIDWGDYLFRQDTMESITQAIQLYILADKLLGPKPQTVPAPVEVTPETYNQLAADLDAFGNALVDLENVLPDLSVLPEGGAELPPPPAALASLYFCIPPNEKMLGYWDTVGDRLFKIRNSQNIDGVERVLALFAPPIDPGMLVRAAAAGLDLSSIIAGLSSPLPSYRFRVMSSKATELASEVRALGQALQSALERRDAEALSLLRNDLELKLLTTQRDLKVMEIEAAEAQIAVLERTREVTAERHSFYAAFETINAQEQLNLDKLSEAQDFQNAAQIVRATGAVLAMIPDFTIGGHGAGGSPAVHATFGGTNLAHVADAGATVLAMLSGIASYKATSAATLGRFDRSSDDAQLQERSTLKELARIDQEIEAAKLRRDIAASDLDVHDVQIENAEKVSQTMTDQYTNVELYQWTANEITQVYYRAYKLAFDTARKAERCYQHELGSPESFLAFGYWDSRKKGLQSANKLLHDIKRMEVRYFDANEREYELTKHVSLRRLDPLALTRLQTTGVCDFEVPEALFDSDHPGHYVRRARSVAVSIPCVAGPYASVSARLTQVANRYRSSTAKASGAGTPKEEYEEATGNDVRFVYNVGAAQSVATSSAQNDAGLFELDFRDDRYLPFEGTGAVGSWRLELPAELRQFDYATISDAILHIRYTAREGGSSLRTLAVASLAEKIQEIAQDLAKTGLHVVCDLRRDDSNAWHALKSTGSATVTIGADRLPYFAQSLAPTLGPVTLLARVAGDPAAYTVAVDDANVALNFSSDFGLNLNDVAGPALGVPFTLTVAPGDTAALDDLSLVAKVDFP
jgi:hypothetical protein